MSQPRRQCGAGEQGRLTDLRLARAGQSAAFERLFAPSKSYALRLAQKFFLSGWEREDIYQEALAGFATALLAFDPGKGVDFDDFARLSMRNSVVACVRAASREKRQGDVRTISLELVDQVESDLYRPDLIVERRAELDGFLDALVHALSSTEWQVLSEIVSGASLDDLARRMGLERRAVENALGRARVKARGLGYSAA